MAPHREKLEDSLHLQIFRQLQALFPASQPLNFVKLRRWTIRVHEAICQNTRAFYAH